MLYNHTKYKKHTFPFSLCYLALLLGVVLSLHSCAKKVDGLNTKQAFARHLAQYSIFKPGPPNYEGTMYDSFDREKELITTLSEDIKSFNPIMARDFITLSFLHNFFPRLFKYDPYTKTFISEIAKIDVDYNKEKNETYVQMHLSPLLFWTSANGTSVAFTADDIVFWYNSIFGNSQINPSLYRKQLMKKADGNKAPIRIEKISSRSLRFILPQIIAEPFLLLDFTIGPRFLFEKALNEGGPDAVRNLLNLDTPPKDVPSIGPYYLVSYHPQKELHLKINPNYHMMDGHTNSLPYIEKQIITIASPIESLNLLKNNQLSTRFISRKELKTLIIDMKKHKKTFPFTIYNAGASLGAKMFSFNQNFKTVAVHKQFWFTSKKFRQAMSSALPRQRIIDEVFDGMGIPALHIFSRSNIFFDPTIKLQYTYNPKKALALLKEDGFYMKNQTLYDIKGNVVEFALTIRSEIPEDYAIAEIFAEELKQLGILMTIQPVDYTNFVTRITTNYNWEAVYISLGENNWPSTGNNLWLSNASLHFWNPKQMSPETKWEARIDRLYFEGLYTVEDTEKRKAIYSEFQSILLEELPIIYSIHTNAFYAYDTKLKNVFVDTLRGSEKIYHYFDK